MHYSAHAAKRAQQRGISAEIVDFVNMHGQCTHRGGDALEYTITRRQASLIIRDLKRFIKKVETSTGVVVITDSSDSDIITVYHRS